MSEDLSYKKAGVDIETADATKRAMAQALSTTNARVLNSLGAFASLFDIKFPEYKHPVLVLKTEEPGSKQKLAFQHGRVKSICYDMINHLINDIAVMGAKPLTVQDCIVCGKIEKQVVTQIVESIAAACREQGCVLTGGETSEQPGVVEVGTYILTSSVVGIIEKSKIIDGSRCSKGDVVVALPSNGLHTNGYSLVRALLAQKPDLENSMVADEKFIDVILRPHICYYKALEPMFNWPELHAMAHITGGGIGGNLNRVLPKGLDASIDLGRLKTLPIFSCIKCAGKIDDADMLRTFNMGVGLTLVCSADASARCIKHLAGFGIQAYLLGELVAGSGQVKFKGQVDWN